MKGELHNYETPWLLICEGCGDQRVLNKLIKKNDISPEKFTVRFVEGRGNIARYLNAAYVASSTFSKNVKAVLIVSDNDDDPAASFAEIQKLLADTGKFAVPAVERTVATKAGSPAVCIAMIPFDELGNLETLCLEAAYSKWNLREPLDHYVSSTPANDWGVSAQSKMRMQAMIAATCRKKPDVNFANHLTLEEDVQISFEHPCFEPIVEFLASFEHLLTK